MSRKPSPGVCGRCGRATRQPTPAELSEAEKWASKADRPTVSSNGHTFNMDDGKLIEVRCMNCISMGSDW